MALDECPLCTSEKESIVINWIQCSICGQWYHIDCLKMSSFQSSLISEYHCFNCDADNPSVLKRKSTRNAKKIDYVALNNGEELRSKDMHRHIERFINFENDKPFDQLVHIIEEDQFNKLDDNYIENLIQKYHSKKPILIKRINPNIFPKNKSKLNLKFPQMSVSDITKVIGEDRPVEVMDVLTQNNSTSWNLGHWRDYYNKPFEDRDRIRNVISLEFSDTELNDLIDIPNFIKSIDVVNELYSAGIIDIKPKVSKYCLMSVKNSFTDFHIDFGGTSVYYTVLKGYKSFIMYPPTADNLKSYENWCLNDNQNSTWFGDLIKPIEQQQFLDKDGEDYYYLNNGLKIDIEAGDLLILPSGWIHSVYTAQDSVVIGGNFLTVSSINTHLKIFEIEKITKVPEKYKFPNFNRIMWLVGYNYLKNGDTGKLSNDEIDSLKALLNFYKIQYNQLYPTKTESSNSETTKKTNSNKNFKQVLKNSIPTGVIGSISQFINDLEKWIDSINHNKELTNGNKSNGEYLKRKIKTEDVSPSNKVKKAKVK